MNNELLKVATPDQMKKIKEGFDISDLEAGIRKWTLLFAIVVVLMGATGVAGFFLGRG